jgi:hypothetical protein
MTGQAMHRHVPTTIPTCSEGPHAETRGPLASLSSFAGGANDSLSALNVASKRVPSGWCRGGGILLLRSCSHGGAGIDEVSIDKPLHEASEREQRSDLVSPAIADACREALCAGGGHCMPSAGLTLDELLEDPLIALANRADGVNWRSYAQLIESAARVLTRARARG